PCVAAAPPGFARCRTACASKLADGRFRTVSFQSHAWEAQTFSPECGAGSSVTRRQSISNRRQPTGTSAGRVPNSLVQHVTEAGCLGGEILVIDAVRGKPMRLSPSHLDTACLHGLQLGRIVG